MSDDDDVLSAEDALEAVAALADELVERERELDAAVRTAALVGVSVRQLAEATRSSKSSVQRRLTASPASDASAADEAEEEMREARLTLAKLRLADASARVRIRQRQAAEIEEANALTRIGPADLDWPVVVDDLDLDDEEGLAK